MVQVGIRTDSSPFVAGYGAPFEILYGTPHGNPYGTSHGASYGAPDEPLHVAPYALRKDLPMRFITGQFGLADWDR